MSLQDLNLRKLYCVSDFDLAPTDQVPRVAFGMLHKEARYDEDYVFILRRLKDALIYAQGMTLASANLPGITEEQKAGWRKGLQSLMGGLNSLTHHGDLTTDSTAVMIRSEIQKMLNLRLFSQKDYKKAYERAIQDLEQTNAQRLRLALQEVENAFSESGIERDEHFRVARHALHELLGDLEGEQCAAGWCLYGLIGLWSEAELGETRRTFATAIRKLRLNEANLAAVALRAKAYISRHKDDHDSALADMSRAMDNCSDPDLALEALVSAIATNNGTTAIKIVENCIAESPLWAVMILGEASLTPVHVAAIKAFERRSGLVRRDVQDLIEQCIESAKALKEIEDDCGIVLSAALDKLQPSEAFSEQVEKAESLELFSLKISIEANKIEGSKIAKDAVAAHLHCAKVQLTEIEVRQHNLEAQRTKKLEDAKQALDITLANVQAKHKAELAAVRVSEGSATKMFGLSGLIFMVYLGVGSFLALRGVSPAVTTPFGYVGLGLSAWPVFQLVLRQGIYSIREWRLLTNMKRQVAIFQRDYAMTVSRLDQEFGDRLEEIEAGYKAAKEDFERAESALSKINGPKEATRLKAA